MVQRRVKPLLSAILILTSGGLCVSLDCSSWEKVDALNFTFLRNGSVFDREVNIQYPLGSYWTEEAEGNVVVHHCPCKLDRPCLRKCCPRSQSMDYHSHKCATHDRPWPWFRPNVASDFEGNLIAAEDDHFRLIFGKYCQGRLLTHPSDGYGFYLNFTDGTLNLPNGKDGGLGPDEFCLEYVPKLETYLPFLCLNPLEHDDRKLAEKCRPWERSEVKNAVFLPNGSVWDTSIGLLYPLSTYWTENRNNSTIIHGCPCGLDKPCLRKCCRSDEAMNFQTLQCMPYEESREKTNGRTVIYEILDWFKPNATSDADGAVTEASGDHFSLIYGNFCWGYLLEPSHYPEDQFYLNFTDGTLSIVQQNLSDLGPNEFCLEYYPEVYQYLPYKCFKRIGEKDPISRAVGPCYNLLYTLYPSALSVSVFFLIISLFVYVVLPDLRNLHGKCLICHMISTLLANVCLAAVQGFGMNFPDDACAAFGFIIYFSLLCSFLWLNIMCIDIYVAFSGMKPMRGNAQERDQKKFRLYVAYAWGLPSLILAMTTFVEYFPYLPGWIPRPEFKKTCWFSKESKLVYYIVPVGIIVTCNTLLFVVTAINIFKISRETRVLKKGDSKRHDQKEDQNRFKLYLKLSVVMGVSWAMEIVSLLVGGSECNWILTDLMNILQGVFIFLIFVCKKKVKDLLVKKMCPSSAASGRGIGGGPSSASSGRSTANTQETSISSSTAAVKSHGDVGSLAKKKY